MKNQKCAEFREAKSPVASPPLGVPFDNGYHLTSRDRNCHSTRGGGRCWYYVGRRWMYAPAHHSSHMQSMTTN